MKHKHHIIPRHMGGTDDPSNLVELTVEEHAAAHRLLYEQHGKLQDKIAWLMLSGKTSEAEELRIELANEGFRSFVKDPVRSASWRKKISDTLKGTSQTQESNAKRSASLKRTYEENPELRHQRSLLAKARGDETRVRLKNGLATKMADARKTSTSWHEAVRSPECRHKKSLADPRRRAVIVEGNTYHGLREAARQTGYTYNKLRWHLIHDTNPDFIRYA